MSLLEPWYLLGLLGLALPWLLHRFSHHEPPVQEFPSSRFLEATDPPATSKRKLRYWLLLAARFLLMALLCLLFAQPWLRSLNDANDSENVQLVVVDTSFSMRALDRWQQAQEELDTVLSQLPENDAVQLFSYASQLSALTDITNEKALLNSAISQTEPSHEPADYGELMRRLDKVAGDIDLPVTATFITDAQRTNLPAQMNTLRAGQLEKFNVVSVESTTPVNYYLRAEAVTTDTVTARVVVNLAAAELSTDTDATAQPVLKRVQLSMKERVLASQDVLVAPGDKPTIHFDDINLPSDTDALLTVSFEQADFLTDDDQVTIPVRGLSATEVVLTSIGGDIDPQARVFLSTALETDGDARVEVRDPNSTLSPSIRHAFVFVDDPSNPPDEVVRFVEDGGNALLLPIEVSPTNQSNLTSEGMAISTIDLPHALALGDMNWFDASFYSAPEFDLDSADRVLLGLEAGVPLLVERPVGEQGRLLMLNDTLDGFNTDLPLQPAFVQLMQQVMQYFNESNALPAEVQVGTDLFLPANTQILSPDGEEMLTLNQLGSNNYLRMVEPGVYNVLGANSQDSVSVVLNPAESDLSGLTRDELDAWQARHDTSRPANLTEDDATPGVVSENLDRQFDNTQTLWRWLLPALLLFLFLETLMANRLLWVRRDGL